MALGKVISPDVKKQGAAHDRHCPLLHLPTGRICGDKNTTDDEDLGGLVMLRAAEAPRNRHIINVT
jgi:hypothetical protein